MADRTNFTRNDISGTQRTRSISDENTTKINEAALNPPAHNLPVAVSRKRRTRMREVIATACILFALQISRIPYVWCDHFSPSFLSAPMFHRLRSKEGEVTRRCGLMHLRLPNSPQRIVPPYSSTEVAIAIGVSLDTFYRTRQIRHERDGLPAPISERGPLKWERTGFDAWLTRHHPMRPKTIANDTFAPPPAASDEEHRERLRTAYGHHGA